MCRVVTRALGAGVGAAAAGRAVTRAALARWEVDALTVDAVLLVSELVTNAVLHARSEVTLTLAVADGVLEAGISDRAPDLAMPRNGREPTAATLGAPGYWSAEGGRGLTLLDTLSDSWGVATLADGKQVWFRLAVPQGWPYLTDCPCDGENLEGVRLESGRRALAVSGAWDD